MTTLENWNNFFDNNNVILEYELTEEIVEPYNEEQQEAYSKLQNFMMYEGINNISCTEGLTIKVNYVQDTKTVIQKMQEDIESLKAKEV